MMTTEEKILDSQQIALPLPDNIGITPMPRAEMISELLTFCVVLPLQAGYPRSAFSRKIASGRFLCVSESILARRPPLTC